MSPTGSDWQEGPPLDRFLLGFARMSSGKILDYGCGEGRFMDFCAEWGLEVYGADSFDGIYTNWEKERPRLLKIADGVVPFEKEAFTLVLANQVFEHVPRSRAPEVASEIARVLAPNGLGVFIFPTLMTVVEPHVGVPFVHWTKSCIHHYVDFACKRDSCSVWGTGDQVANEADAQQCPAKIGWTGAAECWRQVFITTIEAYGPLHSLRPVSS
mgnify:CR=1 FL=1